MTFGADHYIPILKVKRGEKAALTLVAEPLRKRITPLLEIVQRTDKSLNKHLETSFKGLSNAVQPYPRCFLDARELEPDGAAGARSVFRRAREEGIVFTPVTGVSRSVDVKPAKEFSTNGLALRLTIADYESGRLLPMTEAFLSREDLSPRNIDLLVDLTSTTDLIADGIARLSTGILAHVPFLQKWRTLTLSACSFPKSMGVVEKNSYELAQREEWIAWRDYFHKQRKKLARLPTYSDCAIQHPTGVEGFDPRIMQVSASVRYTLAEQWLLIKGQSTRFKSAGIQFPLLAERLVADDLKVYFMGATHCMGCKSMKAASDGAPKLGSAEVWRRLGTIHHVSMVMYGLDSLP